MAKASFDRITAATSFSCTATTPRISRSEWPRGNIVDWEFSEAMRSPRLPAGWFLLPSAALSALILIAFLH